VVARAWREPVEDRRAYLVSVVKGRKVLDIGCVGHRVDLAEDGEHLHTLLRGSAGSILGVDILPKEIELLRSRGFNVICQDITAQPLNEKFEVIIAGEVIEHLSNPGGLFHAAVQMLAPGGRLVLTTPNPYSDSNIRDAITGSFRESVDHVTLLTAYNVAELAEREGLRLDTYRGVCGRRLHKLHNRIKYSMALKRYGGPATDRFSRRLIFECVLQ
jgi:2-polyprenyl-3-methyl-5-hydroxy-6-metoxy-1,4-benzoquinol methylase